MTRLILIRHGQSQANLLKIFAGHQDFPLSDLGRQQAQISGEYVCSHYAIDGIYSSDLSRAYETAQAVARLTGLPIHTDKGLREIYAGLWEGHHFSELEVLFPESRGIWTTDVGRCHPEGGESVAMLQERFLKALDGICRDNPGKTLFIATHATAIRTLHCHFLGKPLEEMKDVPWVSNASLTVLRWEDGVYHPEQISFDGHLKEFTSQLPKEA